jgi:hypothetical protein
VNRQDPACPAARIFAIVPKPQRVSQAMRTPPWTFLGYRAVNRLIVFAAVHAVRRQTPNRLVSQSSVFCPEKLTQPFRGASSAGTGAHRVHALHLVANALPRVTHGVLRAVQASTELRGAARTAKGFPHGCRQDAAWVAGIQQPLLAGRPGSSVRRVFARGGPVVLQGP